MKKLIALLGLTVLLAACSPVVEEETVEEIPPIAELPEVEPLPTSESVVELFTQKIGNGWDVSADMDEQLITVWFTIPVGLPSLDPIAEKFLGALNELNAETGLDFNLELRGLKDEGGALMMAIQNGDVQIMEKEVLAVEAFRLEPAAPIIVAPQLEEPIEELAEEAPALDLTAFFQDVRAHQQAQYGWDARFLDDVDFPRLYDQFLANRGVSDDVESFATFINQTVPLKEGWQEIVRSDFRNREDFDFIRNATSGEYDETGIYPDVFEAAPYGDGSMYVIYNEWVSGKDGSLGRTRIGTANARTGNVQYEVNFTRLIEDSSY